MILKFGIIGMGFVGKAVYNTRTQLDFDPFLEDCLIDSNPQLKYTGSYENLDKTDAVFVCVPSPMNKDGSCDTSILESVMEKLKDYDGLIISKVTAPPTIYTKLQEQFPNLVYSPEYLTAANADYDYRNSEFCVIGGKSKAYTNLAQLAMEQHIPNCQEYIMCSIEEASMMKYSINSFLATKVIFMNEIVELCDKAGIKAETVIDLMKLDDRIGHSHMQVPGPDGYLGFGGACFPKDTRALLEFAKSNKTSLMVLNSAVVKNGLLRNDI
jgi:UDPglucose 6-dehydrogenase